MEQALAPGSDIPRPPRSRWRRGEGGLHAASDAWLARIRELADYVGELVMVDGIQAGCGRTGTFLGFEGALGLRPDLGCQPPAGPSVSGEW
ncbi:aminotransferase class III-fold pyridoxal phosphate-dependent enzyme [Streptomyces sp. NPDC002324]